ncbi:hypothetical protein Pf1_01027 [Flavobacterium columnare]|nr:hypothetical protein Pf1_01027 [Flavobacterium columnare]
MQIFSVDKIFIYNRVLKEKEINLIKDQHQNALNYTDLSRPNLIKKI